jgi:hypothetical protein
MQTQKNSKNKTNTESMTPPTTKKQRRKTLLRTTTIKGIQWQQWEHPSGYIFYYNEHSKTSTKITPPGFSKPTHKTPQVAHAHKKWKRLFGSLAKKFINNPMGAPVKEKNGIPFRNEALLSPLFQKALKIHNIYVQQMKPILHPLKQEEEE